MLDDDGYQERRTVRLASGLDIGKSTRMGGHSRDRNREQDRGYPAEPQVCFNVNLSSMEHVGRTDASGWSKGYRR